MTISTRYSARLEGASASPMLLLAERASVLRRANVDVISLAVGEPDFPCPQHIQDAAIAAIRKGSVRYTAVDGTPELKAAVVEKFCRENGLVYTADQISVGTGAKQLIFSALMATINPGDEVIIQAPYYPSYLEITRLCGGVPVILPCDQASDFKLSAEALDRQISERTKWIILNSPSNPAGAVYSDDELRALGDVLAVHPEIFILTDDIYEHLNYGTKPFATIAAADPRLYDRTLTVNGVSKAYCMTGWRIGYAGGPKELIRRMALVQSQCTSCPPSVSQAAALQALVGPQDFLANYRDKYKSRRDIVVNSFSRQSLLDCIAPEGAFYVYPSCARAIGRKTPQGQEIRNDTDFAVYLLEAAGVAVVPGREFGLSPHFRISFAASEDVLDDACRRIDKACNVLRF